MAEHKPNWDTIRQWLGVLMPVILILFGAIVYNLNVRAINAANNYTDEAVYAAPFYLREDGKVLEERVKSFEPQFEDMKKIMGRILDKLDELD